MGTLNSEKFWENVYSFFPECYRAEDAENGYALRKYIEATCAGGFEKVIEETTKLMNLVDPDRVDSKYLPYLYSSMGLTIFRGIPEVYLRKLYPMLTTLFSMKGTVEVIEYLSTIVSGVKSEIDVSDNFNEDFSVDVRLEMDIDSSTGSLPDRELLLRIIREFVPFYCVVTIIYLYTFSDNSNFRSRDEEMYLKLNIKETDENKGARLVEEIKDKFKISDGLDTKTMHSINNDTIDSVTNSVYNTTNGRFYTGPNDTFDKAINTSTGEVTYYF